MNCTALELRKLLAMTHGETQSLHGIPLAILHQMCQPLYSLLSGAQQAKFKSSVQATELDEVNPFLSASDTTPFYIK